jgi:DNA-binding transcriptional LysR family regulator
LDGGASTIDLVRVAAGERFPVRLILSVLASRAIGGGRPRVQFSSFREGSVPEDQTVDLLVQTGAAPAGECRAREAGKLSVGLFAHKTYLAAHGAPRKAEDLSKFALIGPESVALAVATFRPLGLGIGPSDFSFKTDSLVGGVNAIRAGLGIGFAYEALTRDDPDIVPVVPELRVEVPAWTLALDGEAASSAVRDVETAIHQRLAESTTISSAASKADHKTDLGVRPIGGKGHGMERSADRLGGSATARS